MRRLYSRGSSSRGVTVDAEGAMLGPDCVLIQRTPEGYRRLDQYEAAAIQAFLFGRTEKPDWLFRQCCRIAHALADRNIALAQIYGLGISTPELDNNQLMQLASAAPFIRANFNPDQPRDPHGRWTNEGTTPTNGPRRGESIPKPGDSGSAEAQLAADNQRENKMVRDIVVQLRLSPAQPQQLHRTISGQGYTYQEVLREAKEMFDK